MDFKKQIITVLVGTVILFIWNAISWMGLPFHNQSLNTVPEQAINFKNLKSHIPKDGVYHYPGLPKDNSPASIKEVEKKLKEDPRITLMVVKKGPSEFFNPTLFVKSFLINLITVVLLFYIIMKLSDKSMKNILTVSITSALLVGVVSDVAQMNWYLFPLGYTIINIIDHLIAFILVGIFFSYYTFKSAH